MSRIGKLPVPVPSGVDVLIDGPLVTVKGPKGTLSHAVAAPIVVEKGEGVLDVKRPDDERESKSLHGLTRTLVNNMVVGVTEGYEKKLEIVGVGWGANLAGNVLKVNVGFAAPVDVPVPQGVAVNVEKQIVTIDGADKQAVGQFAAQVRAVKKPEPYQGKGIKYTDEIIRRKQGKQFGS